MIITYTGMPWKVEVSWEERIPDYQYKTATEGEIIAEAERFAHWLNDNLGMDRWTPCARTKDNPKPLGSGDHQLVNWLRLSFQFMVKTEEETILLRMKFA